MELGVILHVLPMPPFDAFQGIKFNGCLALYIMQTYEMSLKP